MWAFHHKNNGKGRRRQSCQQCSIEQRIAGQVMLPLDLPCRVHGYPELWPENLDAWDVWCTVSNQLVIHQTDNPKKPIIDLNLAAVVPVVNLYARGFEARQMCLEKVLLVHRAWYSKGIYDFFPGGKQ